MTVYLLKSLHIIFVVTWFAGLFYIVRLFIYHAEANLKAEPEKSILIKQYQLMQKRLWYIITWPSCILTLIVALWLLIEHHLAYLKSPWMHLKLGFVAVLFFYQIITHRIYKKFQNNMISWTSFKLRLWNELATLLLIFIVFLVVYQRLDVYRGIIGFIVVVLALMGGIKLYQRFRKEK